MLTTVFLYVIVAFLLAVFIYLILPSFYKKYVYKFPGEEFLHSGDICLTFDDGPDPLVTPQLLKLLEKNNAKGSFFINGQNAKKYPGIVREIDKKGHIVGEHGYAHLNAWTAPPWRYWKDLAQCKKTLDEIVGATNERFFRPAYGKVNLLTFIFLSINKRKMILWNVNSNDYNLSSSKDIVDTVIREIKSGSVVLMHDGCAENEQQGQEKVKAVELLLELPELKNQEFSTVERSI